MKIIGKIGLAAFFVVLCSTVAYSKPVKSNFEISINGQPIKADYTILVEENRTLVPLRVVAQELGYSVNWQEESRSVDIKNNDDKIVFTIDSENILMNSKKLSIDSKARIYKNKTYIPLRALENLGLNIHWNEDKKSINLEKSNSIALIENGLKSINNKKDEGADISSFEYWDSINNYSREVIMSSEEIKKYNEKNTLEEKTMVNLSSIGDTVKSEKYISDLKRITEFTKKMYNSKGEVFTEKDYSTIRDNINMVESEYFEVRRGVINKRTIMRTYPTNEGFFYAMDDNLDKAVETAIYPWEEIVIYHESKDGQWLYGQIFNSYGWVPKENISFGNKSTIDNYLKNSDFVVVTQDKINIDGLQLDMGTKVPLVGEDENYYNILLPTSSASLEVRQGKIEKDKANVGYLEFTRANMIKQAIKFYGEVYGWGGLKNSRDCSGLIQDIYRSFGILIPRNSADQGAAKMGRLINIKSLDKSNKLKKIKELGIGTSMHISGHVMMYMGIDKSGEPVAIHQYTGQYVNGKYVNAQKCDITSVNIIGSNKKTYLENTYALKFFK